MAQAAPAPQPTAYGVPANSLRTMKFVVEIPSELVLMAEDQAQAQGMTLARWVQEYAVTGIQMQLTG